MKVLVTGGYGYKGSVLVPKLEALGHEVTIVDTLWFGACFLKSHRTTFHMGDIRSLDGWEKWLPGHDAVIHLAGIANDPCGELDAKLTWEVNVLATEFLAQACVRAGVRQFIYASSASVYGLKGNVAVTETDSLTPVSDYNKTKMCAERILRSYDEDFALQIIRPATICGMSPRMRLDTVVNMLTAQALRTGKIVAHCGQHGATLMRPNTHIDDITDLYCWMLARPHITGTYNAGFENLSVGDIAKQIALATSAEISITEVADKRSYLVNSDKLLGVGFKPKRTVAGAIDDIIDAHKAGRLEPDPRHVNLKWMQANGWVKA